ncbi:MAG: hypothetical protein ACUVR3_09020 [Candidatus Roseilinea sp.]|uniref:hypothetical protein n=1 Tax=Candidatus Roseilinea sp. TaxID=2838777 RepID=UPI00404B1652
MDIQIEDARAFALTLRTRMPFRYGIAQMVEVPHVFAQVTLAAGATRATGLAADHLPPKWFTKNPHTSPADDIAEMVAVIQHALRLARLAQPGKTVFDLWQQIYHDQRAWGNAQSYPPLLYGFGASLVERALIDAYYKATGVTFADAVRANALGIRLSDIYPELSHNQPSDYLPAQPLGQITVRHSVGLSDPLADAEIPDTERLDDGLPQSLAACSGLTACLISSSNCAASRPKTSIAWRALQHYSKTTCRPTMPSPLMATRCINTWTRSTSSGAH